MTKIHSIILVALLGLNLFAVQGWGQDAAHLLSPQTRDFFHTVSHYTGTVNMSIPLYTYKDRDFEIPITLSYNATGFIPSKREGPVGLNWALNAGGAVVRKVNGLPDDCSGKNEKGDRVSPMGVWAGAKNRKLVNLSKEDIFELKVGEEKDGYWTANDVELTPDEFTFVAPGLSGWFYINFDGTVKCAGNKPFVVELGGMGEQPAKGTKMAYSTITITADNGYQYLFGGGDAEKEWSLSFNKDITESSPVVTAWHLKKITAAPNGKTVEYEYRDFDAATDYLLNVFYQQASKPEEGMTGYTAETVLSWEKNLMLDVTKTVYLSKIKTGNLAINFHYSKKALYFIQYTSNIPSLLDPLGSLYASRIPPLEKRLKEEFDNYNRRDLKLDSINVYYANDNITEFSFDHTYYPGIERTRDNVDTRQRLFLKSVSEKHRLPYTFTYYNTDIDFPDPLTLGIDHWGFWNGKDGNKSLIPAAEQIYDNIVYTSTEREPDTTLCRVGLLHSITYPTGGQTTFLYEPHFYTQRLDRLVKNFYYIKLDPVQGFTGGARIRKVQHTDGIDTLSYNYSYPQGGLLLNWPKYAIFLFYLNWNPVFYAEGRPYPVTLYPGESFITYPEVIQQKGTGKDGWIKYSYTNYATLPDDNTAYSKYHKGYDRWERWGMEDWMAQKSRYDSRYFERGLLKEMSVFDVNRKCVERKIIEYTDRKIYSNEWIPSSVVTEYMVSSYKIYHYPIAVQRETVTQYFDGDSVTTVTDYDYHNRKDTYPVSVTTTASDGAALKTEYRYIDGRRDNAEYAEMRKRNIRNIPVETIRYKNGAVTGASLINFKFFNELSNWNVYPSEVLQLETKAPVSDFDSVNVDKRLKPQVRYERYDSYGNVLQQRGVDGLTVSYLWDKSGLYKLAEVVGATYDELQKAVAGMNLEVPDTDYLQRLRTLREKLPQALITNYTYKPLVGITSQTDANGRTTYYEYDELNRLKRVRDHEGMVLKEYEVHYYND